MLEVTVVRRIIAALAVMAVSAPLAYGQSAQGKSTAAKAAPARTTQAAPAPAKPSEEQTKTLNLTAYAELLRSDVRTQKVAIIAQVMGFSEQEDAAFWPIYRDYDTEMSKLGDERVALIADYAKNFENITDDLADKLVAKAIDLESRRQAARNKCYDRVRTALSPRTAMRFLQVEHQLQQLIDLQISASLPIVQ